MATSGPDTGITRYNADRGGDREPSGSNPNRGSQPIPPLRFIDALKLRLLDTKTGSMGRILKFSRRAFEGG